MAAELGKWTTVIAEAFEESYGGRLDMSRFPSNEAHGLEAEE